MSLLLRGNCLAPRGRRFRAGMARLRILPLNLPIALAEARRFELSFRDSSSRGHRQKAREWWACGAGLCGFQSSSSKPSGRALFPVDDRGDALSLRGHWRLQLALPDVNCACGGRGRLRVGCRRRFRCVVSPEHSAAPLVFVDRYRLTGSSGFAATHLLRRGPGLQVGPHKPLVFQPGVRPLGCDPGETRAC